MADPSVVERRKTAPELGRGQSERCYGLGQWASLSGPPGDHMRGEDVRGDSGGGGGGGGGGGTPMPRAWRPVEGCSPRDGLI